MSRTRGHRRRKLTIPPDELCTWHICGHWRRRCWFMRALHGPHPWERAAMLRRFKLQRERAPDADG